ncbi:patatin-like phospholipase domain-containing protein 3 isoform X1 [Centruroides sculpturatus]|uniref:patatin-like phospholipase domain-containing protein 3 isoform X1 n=1 Tax=Centruroides sculpturatus TaxID=218467 RepID=UPI000C6D8D5E|nr:patatin-like phospholipase domain-containing protein 3 isoform X1 [Centruroides sculpturatus]
MSRVVRRAGDRPDPSRAHPCFAGCGYLGMYQLGAAACFRLNAPYLFGRKAAGASVGALVAAANLCRVPLDDCARGLVRAAVRARRTPLGPISPGFKILDIIRRGMDEVLPLDAHLLCDGRLFVSVTRVSDGRNVLLSRFHTRDELLQALVCSCFIPLYCGFAYPRFRGEAYADGGLSDNQPLLDEHTLTVAPFYGESDVCPTDSSCSLIQIYLGGTSLAITPANLHRFGGILFPGDARTLGRLCQQGFDDAFRFLRDNDFPTAWGGPERPKRPSSSFPPDCSYPAPTPRPRGSDMPETVRKVIEEESSETGLPIFSPSFLWRGPGKMLRLLRSASVRLTCRLLDGSRKLCLAAGCRLIDGAEKLLLLLTRALEKLEPDAGGYGLYCRWAVQEFHPGLCQSKAEGGNPLPAEKRPVGRLRLLMDSDPLPAPTADREELDRAARALADRALRAARTALDGLEGGGRPTELEEVLKMTEEKEALMSFYYLDEKRRVNRTSIFSMEDEKGALS